MNPEVAASSAMLLFAASSIYAAIGDVATMRIGNKLILAMLAGYVVFAQLAGFDPTVIGLSLLVAAAVLVGGFALFSAGVMGGGDAKLAAVTVLWVGPALALPFLFWTVVYGGILALAFLFLRALPLPSSLGNLDWIARLHQKGNGIPYGVALVGASLTVLPGTEWFSLAL